MSPSHQDLAFWSVQRALGLAPWLLGLAVGLTAVVALWRSLPRRTTRPGLARFVTGEESGRAMLEFVMVFPFFTLVVLLVVQMALVVNARVVAGYAAYAAARSAVVWLPEGDEVATARAGQAAAIGCMPISPDIRHVSRRLLPGLSELAGSPVSDLVATLDAVPLAPLFVHTELERHLRRAGGKYRYAKLLTRVEIERSAGPDSSEPHDLVTVRVRHHYFLAVPWAGELFGQLLGGWTGRFLPFLPIEEQFTLQNEGRVDTLARKRGPRR